MSKYVTKAESTRKLKRKWSTVLSEQAGIAANGRIHKASLLKSRAAGRNAAQRKLVSLGANPYGAGGRKLDPYSFLDEMQLDTDGMLMTRQSLLPPSFNLDPEHSFKDAPAVPETPEPPPSEPTKKPLPQPSINKPLTKEDTGTTPWWMPEPKGGMPDAKQPGPPCPGMISTPKSVSKEIGGSLRRLHASRFRGGDLGEHDKRLVEHLTGSFVPADFNQTEASELLRGRHRSEQYYKGESTTNSTDAMIDTAALKVKIEFEKAVNDLEEERWKHPSNWFYRELIDAARLNIRLMAGAIGTAMAAGITHFTGLYTAGMGIRQMSAALRDAGIDMIRTVRGAAIAAGVDDDAANGMVRQLNHEVSAMAARLVPIVSQHILRERKANRQR